MVSTQLMGGRYSKANTSWLLHPASWKDGEGRVQDETSGSDFQMSLFPWIGISFAFLILDVTSLWQWVYHMMRAISSVF